MRKTESSPGHPRDVRTYTRSASQRLLGSKMFNVLRCHVPHNDENSMVATPPPYEKSGPCRRSTRCLSRAALNGLSANAHTI